jgi:hypothetical protein
MTNNKLINANIRPRIQEVVYKAILTIVNISLEPITEYKKG